MLINDMQGDTLQHKVKVTVIDKKLYPDLQQKYCMDPLSGACPVYNVGDEYVFSRYSSKDDLRREEDFVEVYVDAAPPAELDIRSAVGDLCGIRRID